jgi:hypothetical protein
LWFRSPTSWRSRGSLLHNCDLRFAAALTLVPRYSFASRYRKLNPKYPLFFYDEGYSADIELHQKTTQEQIVNLFARQVGTTELEVRSS